MTHRKEAPVFRVCLWLFCFGLACAGGVLAQSPLPPLASAQGRDAVVTPAGRGILITFLPAEWPNAYWSVGGNAAWDWQGSGDGRVIRMTLEGAPPCKKRPMAW